MKLKRTHLTALTCAALLGSAALSQGATISWNFDDGTAQGWTEIRGSTGGANNRVFAVTTDEPQAGSHALTQVNGDTDTHTNTALWRSPAFTLDGSGGISAQIWGGDAGPNPPTTSASVAATVPGSSGFQGIALRRVSDDTYLHWAGKIDNGGIYEGVTISETQLDALFAGAPTAAYTLDVIDYANGGWGHIKLDTVSVAAVVVPEPSAMLLGGLGMLALLRRRR